MITKVEKIGGHSSKGEHSYGFEVVCKDMRNLRFALRPQKHGRKELHERILTYAFPLNNKRELFAFTNKEKLNVGNGWSVYDTRAELNRLLGPSGNSEWKISELNKDYALCDSYPAIIAVPSRASDGVLRSVAAFRSRNRLPVLAWIHPSGATITRCSQPLIGVKNKRSSDDEAYMQMILDTNPLNKSKLGIMDARPKANAIANKARNGGFESEDEYRMSEVLFLNIHNIHVIRDSLSKLKDMVWPGNTVTDEKWLSVLEATGWLKHLKRILIGAAQIVERIDKRQMSIVVHCSDGWDRTAQLTAISMLLLDHYYRTLAGFQVLIEKEWISFGHKFQQRVGHGDHRHTDSDRSPIFLQFIDCVWQVTHQFPHAFEFNEDFLITILDHLYSCRFGTFLYNCEREKVAADLKNKTVSLWSFIEANRDQYLNPIYDPDTTVLKPLASARYINLWKSYYCRWMTATAVKSGYQVRFQIIKDMITLQKDLSQKLMNLGSIDS